MSRKFNRVEITLDVLHDTFIVINFIVHFSRSVVIEIFAKELIQIVIYARYLYICKFFFMCFRHIVSWL